MTNQSTYTRPMPSFATMHAMQNISSAPLAKDKPLLKTPIPGTDWIRVKTTQGNTFYNNRVTKSSVWTIPEEIKDAVQVFEEEEAAQAEAERERLARKEIEKEVGRIRGEVEGAVAKRKADDTTSESANSKKTKTSASNNDDGEESEEEDWQREAAAQLAAEAEAAEKEKAEEDERHREEARKAQQEIEDKAAKMNLPRREDLSLEEAKALFKVRKLFFVIIFVNFFE